MKITSKRIKIMKLLDVFLRYIYHTPLSVVIIYDSYFETLEIATCSDSFCRIRSYKSYSPKNCCHRC